jgi:hypothetical protein
MSLVFSWRARQTWRRRTGNAAARMQRVSSPSQNSRAALQGWQNCPHKGHRSRQERRCRVFAQHWSAGMTPPPLIARTNRKRLLLSRGNEMQSHRLVALHVARHCRTRVIKSPLNAFTVSRSKTKTTLATQFKNA